MIAELFKFLMERGLLSPTILACALICVVYFQTGVDAEQRKSIDDLHDQQRVIAKAVEETSINNRITAAILSRIDEHGTKAEMVHREKDMERREQSIGKK